MKKGKFGLVLCFYPIAAFACVILKQPVVGAIILALAIFLEKDPWTGRQTFQAWLLSLLVSFFSDVVPWGVSLFEISFLSTFLTTVATVFSVVIYLGAIILSILGILRVMKDEEANIPLLSDLAYHIYGDRKPRPVPGQVPPPYSPQYPPCPPQAGVPQTGGPQTGGPQTGEPQSGGQQTGSSQTGGPTDN